MSDRAGDKLAKALVFVVAAAVAGYALTCAALGAMQLTPYLGIAKEFGPVAVYGEAMAAMFFAFFVSWVFSDSNEGADSDE